MWEEVERFRAVAENGDTFVVVRWRHLVGHRPLRGPTTRHGGAEELRLDDGRAVNWLTEDRFQILDTDQVIRKLG